MLLRVEFLVQIVTDAASAAATAEVGDNSDAGTVLTLLTITCMVSALLKVWATFRTIVATSEGTVDPSIMR